MSALSIVKLTDLTIPNGTAVSRWVLAERECGDAELITIYAPGTLDALTYTIEVSYDQDNGANTTYSPTNVTTLNDGAGDVAPPAATKACSYPGFAVKAWRIKASGNVTADRVFGLTKSVRGE